MNGFIREMFTFVGKKDSFRFKITKVIFQWKHLGWSCTEEIEVPYDAAWDVFHATRENLDWKCKELKDLLGKKYVESTEVKK